jgi:hypothetical protein
MPTNAVYVHALAGGQREDMSETGHRHLPACWGTVHSGLPPKTPLFNGTICRGDSAFVQHGESLNRRLRSSWEPSCQAVLWDC